MRNVTFSEGNAPCVVDIAGMKVGITICEDIWHREPAEAAKRIGAELLVNLNASPFHRGKHKERWQALASRTTEQKIPMIYVNQVGGQDELVFDGGSFATNADGELAVVAPDFEEGCFEIGRAHGPRVGGGSRRDPRRPCRMLPPCGRRWC
jgi:NAD+ synthase (glutamine-hydrolysing)